MNRHAYLILAHTAEDQLRALVSTLDDPRNDIFIHIDAKASFGPEALIGAAKLSGLYFTDRIAVNWGGVSIMRAELALLEKSTTTGTYAYYHLLSGMDLPIKPQDTIHEFFDKNRGWEFIDMWKMESHTLDRVRYYTIFPEGARKFYTNLPTKAVKLILKGLHISMNKDVEFKFASQWFSITDGLARYIVGHRDYLEKVFRRTTMIDEIFLPTLVWNSPFRDKIYPTDELSNVEHQSATRLIDWTRGESIRHPWTFRADDFEMLRGSKALWARKFDSKVDAQIIRMVIEKLAKTQL